MKSRVDNNGASFDFYFEENILSIYPDDPYIYINGKIVALKTETVEDYNTKESFEFPMPQKPTKNGEGYLIPVSIVEEKLGVKGNSDGFVITEEIVNDNIEKNPSNPNKPDNGTSGGSNQGQGGNSGSGNSGGSSNNGGSSNSGGSGNSGSGNGGSNSGSGNTGGGSTGGGNSGGNTGGGNTGGGGNSGGGGTVTPPVVSGLTPQQMADRATSLGWIYKSTINYKNYAYEEGTVKYGMMAISDKYVGITLLYNNQTFEQIVHSTLNLLLPSGGNKVYSIVSGPFNNQTLQLDGKTVKIE